VGGAGLVKKIFENHRMFQSWHFGHENFINCFVLFLFAVFLSLSVRTVLHGPWPWPPMVAKIKMKI